MKKIILLLLAFSTLSFSACDEHSKKTENAKISLSDNQMRLLENLLNNDAEISALDGDSIFGLNELGIDLAIKGSQISKEYHQNEVAADNKFKGKTLMVSGIVQSIDKDFLDNAILRLRVKNMFMSVMAYVHNDELSFLAGLSKGQSVSLVCRGDGMVIGSVVLRDCENSSQYILTKQKKIVEDFLSGKQRSSKSAASVIAIVINMNRILNENSSCFQPASTFVQCEKELSQLKVNKEEVALISQSLLRGELPENDNVAEGNSGLSKEITPNLAVEPAIEKLCSENYPCQLVTIIDHTDWNAVQSALAFATKMDIKENVKWTGKTQGHAGHVVRNNQDTPAEKCIGFDVVSKMGSRMGSGPVSVCVKDAGAIEIK